MYGRLSGLFRPDGYTSRGIPLSQLLAMRRQGRRGDSMLAHVNPREAAMLRQMGGSGGINPATGLREFAPASKKEGGFGGGSLGGGTASKGSGAKSSGVGTVGAADVSRSGGTSIGKAGTTEGGKPTKTGGTTTGGTTTGGGYANPAIGSEAAAIGHMGVDQASTGYSGDVAAGIGGALGSAFGGIGTAIGTGIGSLVDAGIADATSTSVTEARDRAYGGGGSTSVGGSRAGAATGRGYDINDVLTGAAPPPIAPPPPPPAPNPNDPDPIVPEELLDYIEPGMTEEQIRAMIATYATNANNSYFQSPDVFDYYAGLLRPAVNAQGYGAVKPIEHQYLNQTFGLSYDPTVQALLTALGEAGLPDTPVAPPPSSGGNVRLERAGRRRH